MGGWIWIPRYTSCAVKGLSGSFPKSFVTTGSHPHSRLACHHKLIFGRSATAVYIYIYYNIRNVEVPTPLFLMPSVTPTEAYDSDVCESYFAIHMERTVVIVDFFIECLHHKLEAHRSLQAFPKSIAAMFECPKYHQISQFCLSPKICQYTYSIFSTFPNEKWEESIGKLPCPRCGHRFLWLRCAARSPTGGESQDAQRGSGSVETGKRCGKPWFLRKMIYPLVI